MAAGAFAVRGYPTDQLFEQAFSTVAPDRATDTLNREQRVPSTAAGFLATWSHAFGGRTMVLGVDRGHVTGQTEETVFRAGTEELTIAEGTQRTLGVFGDHSWGLGGRGALTVGARFDQWHNVDARRITNGVSTSLNDRRSRSFSPRASLLLRLGPGLLRDLLRLPRVPRPDPERALPHVPGGERRDAGERPAGGGERGGGRSGVPGRRRRLSLRATAFRMHLGDTVANVTLSSQPGLITRQRQNLGSRALAGDRGGRGGADRPGGILRRAGCAPTPGCARFRPTGPSRGSGSRNRP